MRQVPKVAGWSSYLITRGCRHRVSGMLHIVWWCRWSKRFFRASSPQDQAHSVRDKRNYSLFTFEMKYINAGQSVFSTTLLSNMLLPLPLLQCLHSQIKHSRQYEPFWCKQRHDWESFYGESLYESQFLFCSFMQHKVWIFNVQNFFAVFFPACPAFLLSVFYAFARK